MRGLRAIIQGDGMAPLLSHPESLEQKLRCMMSWEEPGLVVWRANNLWDTICRVSKLKRLKTSNGMFSHILLDFES